MHAQPSRRLEAEATRTLIVRSPERHKVCTKITGKRPFYYVICVSNVTIDDAV